MTATDTEAALLAAIRANPGDIARRMVYADALADAGRELEAIMQRIIAKPGEDRWRLDYAAELERTAGTVACEYGYGQYPGNHSQCSRCHGTGRVSDGRAELAEFVRVQVELAARDDERCRCRECQPTGQHHNGPCRSPLKPLRARERELWPAVRGAFEGGGVYAFIGDPSTIGSSDPIVFVRRGLPAVVRCTIAKWMGGECERCSGWGTDRGESLSTGCGGCTGCGGDNGMVGTGRTPGIGPRLAQRWPIERVEVTDRKAFLNFTAKYTWWRASGWVGSHDEDSNLPDPIFVTIADLYTESNMLSNSTLRDQHLAFDSEPAARTALSDALLAWARGQAFRAQHENEN